MTQSQPEGQATDEGSEIVVREFGAPATTGAAAQWGATYATAVRLAAGVAGVLADRAREIAESKQGQEQAPTEAGVATEPEVPGTLVFGFAADLPARFGRVTGAVVDSTGFVREVTGYGWRLVAASPVGWLISKPVDAVMVRVDAESDRLHAIGRAEVVQGKALVETVVDTTIDGVLDNVSESEALNDLIRDKAAGIGDVAIQEVRETGAAADSLTDSAVRRLLRRPPRDLPPKRATDQ
jgi:hypothetical protein